MRSTSSNQAKSVNPNIGGERAVIAKVCLILKSTWISILGVFNIRRQIEGDLVIMAGLFPPF